MGWKKITFLKKSEQLNMFPEFDDSQKAEEVVGESGLENTDQLKKKRTRSDNYILQSYKASGSGNCNTHPSECHRGGKVEEGDDMIRAIPMKGIGGPHFFFHEGKCADNGVQRIETQLSRSLSR